MQLGKLASLTGVSIRMLRYYETAGLLHPMRSGTNYRHFTQQDVETVRQVLMLNAAGFTLPVAERTAVWLSIQTEVIPSDNKASCGAVKSYI